jgi:hypothetical protein
MMLAGLIVHALGPAGLVLLAVVGLCLHKR